MEELREQIFKAITKSHANDEKFPSMLLFPYTGHNNIVIKDTDIYDLIDKAIKETK